VGSLVDWFIVVDRLHVGSLCVDFPYIAFKNGVAPCLCDVLSVRIGGIVIDVAFPCCGRFLVSYPA